MCGICGVVSLDGTPIDPAAILAMRETMPHRGPDDCGIWCRREIGLGHTRLSIIDLSPAGRQPMTDCDDACLIAYNGEIYNYRSLRESLRSLGYGFRSSSDTEVILQAYRAWGTDCLERLDGMFAIALWDTRARRLLLARDRMGVKPVYLMQRGGQLAFASEIKALLAWSSDRLEIEEDALAEYLTFRDTSGERTLLRSVRRLLPGHAMLVERGIAKSWRFWEAPDLDARWNDTELLGEVLARSVSDQMVSDVPVGTLCSGGIDSSLVTAFASRHKGGELHTFSVGFPDHPCDESGYAETVARHVGTRHHVLRANAESFARDLVGMTRHHDEPLKYENSVLLYQVCKLAREHGVIVLLTGEGADELFAGYPHLALLHRIARYRPFRSPLRRLPVPWGRLPLPSRAVRWAHALLTDEEDLVVYSSAFTPSVHVGELIGASRQPDFGYRQLVLEETRALPLVERVRRYDLATYLPPILMRQDKMSMAASVESRVPMLGNRVIDWAMRQRVDRFVSRGNGKLPLRSLAYEMLPAEIIDRPKVGFVTPTSEWMRASATLREMLDLLVEPAARVGQFVHRPAVARYVREHVEGRADRAQLLWTLLSLELWLRFVVEEPRPVPGAKDVTTLHA